MIARQASRRRGVTATPGQGRWTVSVAQSKTTKPKPFAVSIRKGNTSSTREYDMPSTTAQCRKLLMSGPSLQTVSSISSSGTARHAQG